MRRKVKIVATVGPASNNATVLQNFLLRGVNVFRLNFSHGSHDDHARNYNLIRQLGHKLGLHTTILADMQGPKLRIGKFENGKILLEAGKEFMLDANDIPGNSSRVSISHPEILPSLTAGSTVLMDDGKLRFQVIKSSADYALLKVVVGGILSDRKGVNVPDIPIALPAITPKDHADMEFALNLGVDWIALSFVQTVQDVEQAKSIINGRAMLVSKLEKPVAARNMEPIIAASDGVMVARGDLGVELGIEHVPTIQRRAIDICHRMGKPVIVATQMLESMIENPYPTRAEVSDVAHAVFDGADATMLSAESAAGKHCIEAVETMDKTIANAEQAPEFINTLDDNIQQPTGSVIDALGIAARQAAQYSSAAALIVYSDSFDAVIRCSRLRPGCPIFWVTDSYELASKVGLFYGVYALIQKREFEPTKITHAIKTLIADHKLAKSGDNVVILDTVSGQHVSIIQI